MKPHSVALILVGLVVLLVGVIAGAVPSLGLSVVCSPSCNVPTVVPNFSLSSTNLTATLIDSSEVVEHGTVIPGDIAGIVVIFGSTGPGNVSVTTQGSTVHFTYPHSGTYTVTDTAQGKFNSTSTNPNTATKTLSLTVQANGQGNVTLNYELRPGYSIAQAGSAVTLVDQAIIVNVTSVSIVIAWGDGTTTTLSAPGATVTHTYPAVNTTMTYSIEETLTGIGPGSAGVVKTSGGNGLVTVAGTSTCGSLCNTTSPPPPTGSTTIFAVTAVTLGLIGGGIVLIAAGFVNRWTAGKGAAVIVVIGLLVLVGFFVGGTGVA